MSLSLGSEEEGGVNLDRLPSSAHALSLDSIPGTRSPKRTDEILIDKLLQELKEIDFTIQQKIEALETIDITIQIVSFKVYEATHAFKVRIGEVTDERNRILSSIENRSELSLILHDLDTKISTLEKELDDKIKLYNQEKIELQQQAEAITFQLDEDTTVMSARFKELKEELRIKIGTLYRAQVMVVNQKYSPRMEQFQNNLLTYEKLQLTGWRVEHSEVKLSEILEEQGLKFTPSGKLLTSSGSHITFQEAQEQGYFKAVTVSLDKVFTFFKERDRQQQAFDQVGPPGSIGYSEGSTADSNMSTEDVRYLKKYVGKPLTLALAEITAKQPRDPIHYLGHYLFKYRYNQDLEEMEKREVDELTQERKLMAQERWRKFVEEEAKNAVLEMILRAEQIAYQNELKRIELEQMLADEEEEGSEMKDLMEEARDKFE